MHITVIEGHPFAHSFGRALCDAYIEGALSAGHDVRKLDIRDLQIPSRHRYGLLPHLSYNPEQDLIRDCIAWSDHLVVVNPIWLGPHNYGLKSFFERNILTTLSHYEQSLSYDPTELPTARSARLVLAGDDRTVKHRSLHRQLSISLMQNLCLSYCGSQHFDVTSINRVQKLSPEERSSILQQITKLGTEAR